MCYYPYDRLSIVLFMESKIHHLLTSWPTGAVRDVGTLVASGYSLPLLAQYRKSNWLTSLGTGALMRTGDKVEYLGGTYALQHDLMLDVHVGERSSVDIDEPMPTGYFGQLRSPFPSRKISTGC